jgi:AcrR family transcriptional regulator
MEPPRSPQLRGAALQARILMVAKEVFLEAGFDRASMDTVAARANTSKRSVYAHFENKETLFLAVLDLVRDLHLQTLGTPEGYGDPGIDAVSAYCAHFLQLLVWEPQVRTCRLAMAEAERLPQSAYAYFEAIFATTLRRIADYLQQQFGLDASTSLARAHDLVDRAVLPRLLRTLFAVDPPISSETVPSIKTVTANVDTATVRRIVTETLVPSTTR